MESMANEVCHGMPTVETPAKPMVEPVPDVGVSNEIGA
jgi:hypothetical protein